MAMLGLELAGPRRSARQRPQAPGHLRRNRSLHDRRHRRGHRMPPGQARPQVSRLGKSRRHLRRPGIGQGGSPRGQGKLQGAGAADASRNREQEPAADAGLPRDAERRPVLGAVGESRCRSGRTSRLQGRAHRVRAVRRGHQLPARSTNATAISCVAPVPASATTIPPEPDYSLLAASACSTTCAVFNTVASSKCLPRICNPIGNPSLLLPHGTVIPGTPTRFAVTV